MVSYILGPSAPFMYLGKLFANSGLNGSQDAETWQIGNESKRDGYSFYSSIPK